MSTALECGYCKDMLIKTDFIHRDDLMKHITEVHPAPWQGEVWNKVSAEDEAVSLDNYTEPVLKEQPDEAYGICPYCREQIPNMTDYANCMQCTHACKGLYSHTVFFDLIHAIWQVIDRGDGENRVEQPRLYGTSPVVLMNEALNKRNILANNALKKAQSDTEPFDLTRIPYSALVRLGTVFKHGEAKYGRENWRHGVRDRDFQLNRANHALKHLLVYIHWLETGEYLGKYALNATLTSLDGNREQGIAGYEEDDLAKVMWFCVTQCELERLESSREDTT